MPRPIPLGEGVLDLIVPAPRALPTALFSSEEERLLLKRSSVDTAGGVYRIFDL